MIVNKKMDFLTDYLINLIMFIIVSLFLHKLSIACTTDFMRNFMSGSMNNIVEIRNENGGTITIEEYIQIILNVVSVICAFFSKILLYASPLLALYQNYVENDSTSEQAISVKAIKNRMTKLINSFDFEESYGNKFLVSCNEYYKEKVESLAEEFERLKIDERCSLDVERYEEIHSKFQEIQQAYLNDIEHIKSIESLSYITDNHKISNTLHTI